MALIELKPAKKLNVADFVKLKVSDHLLPKSLTRLKTISISETNVCKLSGRASTMTIDILKGIPLDRMFNYVSLRGVVISGEWMVPDGCSGGVVISLMDRRMKGFRHGLIAELKARASVRTFQLKFIPNYSLCIDDALKKPWEIFFKLVQVPIEDGFFPLAIEIAVMVEQCKSIIQHGLRMTVLNQSVGDVNGVDLELPSGSIDDNLELFSNSNVVLSRLNKRETRTRSSSGTRFSNKENPKRVVSSSSEVESGSDNDVNDIVV